jgi:hypothetical protein
MQQAMSSQDTRKRHDKATILLLLRTNDLAVERAIVALYRRQTKDEKAVGGTKHANGRGFNHTHARTGTYCAKWILSGKRLTGKWLQECRQMAIFYHRQLLEIARANGR